MDCKKCIQMIDEYLLEPNNINRDWVECLTVYRGCLERMRPKKPIEKQDIFGDTWIICPNCGNNVLINIANGKVFDYCLHCGQALNWMDE